MRAKVSSIPEGVHPVIYALFDERGGLDRAAMKRQIEVCIDQGAVGVVALGLATEVRFLTKEMQLQIIEWCAADIAGRVPFGVTVFAETAEELRSRTIAATAAGADWVIMQPPADAKDEAHLRRSFELALADLKEPVALQNMPQFIGVGLSVGMITELAARHENLIAIKQEVSAVETAELVQRLEGRAQVLSGRGGIELVDCMAGGVSGHIPAPEYADFLVTLWKQKQAGHDREAMEIYSRYLPLATFILQSVETLTTYGKLLFCLRYGIDFHQRPHAEKPTLQGVQFLTAHAQWAGIDTDGWAPRIGSILELGNLVHR